MGRQEAKEKRMSYKSNRRYEPERFCRSFDGWMQARRDGDRRQMNRYINEIYEYLRDFIYYTLWRRFPQQMENEEIRSELIQDFWVEVMKALPGYDYHKARVTTFLEPYAYSAGRAYYRQLYHTTSYYADVRGVLEKAVNALQLEGGDEPEIDELVRRTGFPRLTVERVCGEMRIDNSMCSLETGFSEIDSILPSEEGIPEEIILQQDLREVFERFRKKLSGEEAFLLRIMWEMEMKGHERLSCWGIGIYLNEKLGEDLTLSKKNYSHGKIKRLKQRIGKKLLRDRETYDYSYVYK